MTRTYFGANVRGPEAGCGTMVVGRVTPTVVHALDQPRSIRTGPSYWRTQSWLRLGRTVASSTRNYKIFKNRNVQYMFRKIIAEWTCDKHTSSCANSLPPPSNSLRYSSSTNSRWLRSPPLAPARLTSRTCPQQHQWERENWERHPRLWGWRVWGCFEPSLLLRTIVLVYLYTVYG